MPRCRIKILQSLKRLNAKIWLQSNPRTTTKVTLANTGTKTQLTHSWNPNSNNCWNQVPASLNILARSWQEPDMGKILPGSVNLGNRTKPSWQGSSKILPRFQKLFLNIKNLHVKGHMQRKIQSSVFFTIIKYTLKKKHSQKFEVYSTISLGDIDV